VVSTSNVQTPLAQEKIAKRGREKQSSPTTEASSQGFRIVHINKRPRISVKVNATNEPQKTTFDGLGESFLFTQSGGQSTQSPTHNTTSQEQQMIKTNGTS